MSTPAMTVVSLHCLMQHAAAMSISFIYSPFSMPRCFFIVNFSVVNVVGCMLLSENTLHVYIYVV